MSLSQQRPIQPLPPQALNRIPEQHVETANGQELAFTANDRSHPRKRHKGLHAIKPLHNASYTHGVVPSVHPTHLATFHTPTMPGNSLPSPAVSDEGTRERRDEQDGDTAAELRALQQSFAIGSRTTAPAKNAQQRTRPAEHRIQNAESRSTLPEPAFGSEQALQLLREKKMGLNEDGTFNVQDCTALIERYRSKAAQASSLGHFAYVRIDMISSAYQQQPQDLFYLMLHQFVCVYYINPHLLPQEVYASYNLSAGIETVERILGRTSELGPASIKFFGVFPMAFNSLLASRQTWNEPLRLVLRFLNALPSTFAGLSRLCSNRGFPPVAEELVSLVYLTSPVLQQALFRSIMRQIWDKADQAQLQNAEAVFTQNQQEMRSNPHDMNVHNSRMFYGSLYRHCYNHPANRTPYDVPRSNGPGMWRVIGSTGPSVAPSPVQFGQAGVQQPRRYASQPSASVPRDRMRNDGQVQGAQHSQAELRSISGQSSQQVASSPRLRMHPPLAPVVPPPHTYQSQHIIFPNDTGQGEQLVPPDRSQRPLGYLSGHRYPLNNGSNRPASVPSQAPATTSLPPPTSVHVQRHTPFFPRPGVAGNQVVPPDPGRQAVHLHHLRSPNLKYFQHDQQHPLERMYQYVADFALLPRRLPGIEHLLQHAFNFTISSADFQSIAPRVSSKDSDANDRHLSRQSLSYRLRCVKDLPPASQMSGWMAQDTDWPSDIYFRCNDLRLQARQRLHFGKDLPTDISEYLKEGPNTIRIISNRPKDAPQLTHHIACEQVRLISHSQIKANLLAIPADETEAAIAKSLRAPSAVDEDADLQVLSTHLTIILTDPSLAKIWDIPVRSTACLHREAFDLETFLVTRPGSNEPGEPCSVDVWKCPICGTDARPTSLVRDLWLEGVRDRLKVLERLDAKAIEVDEHASWEIKEAQSGMQMKREQWRGKSKTIAQPDWAAPVATQAPTPLGSQAGGQPVELGADASRFASSTAPFRPPSQATRRESEIIVLDDD
ncbi:MAG: hypothetical protein M1828_002333 [Chrysothrix sp. TS-e1954]|nr:MAG: hypothetical protein M1828_002333 [Chrysothrix sp. TS-e1954]